MFSLIQANYFDRHNVSLPGVSKFFKKSAHEELEHAKKLMDFQNKRGGAVKLEAIRAPAKAEWGSALDAMKAAQQLERDVNQSLLDLHTISDKHGDFQVCSYVWTLCQIRKAIVPYMDSGSVESLLNSKVVVLFNSYC